MDISFLSLAPFKLGPDDMAWVRSTFDSLSREARIAQLFNLASFGNDPDEPARLARLQPGGLTRFFGPDGEHELGLLSDFRQASRIPPLISADLEGSRMSLGFGTQVPNPLALAAIDDVAATREISRIMAEEAAALGVNWSFTPVLDINAAFRSSIVATRGFGSDVDRIQRHALTQLQTFRDHGIASAVKHWPGEGYDDRDQHLVTTINPLSVDEWEAKFGKLYRAAIKAGVLSVMSAHIAFPAFVRSLDPDAGIEAFRPASLSRVLNIELLRKRLGFNGLIFSDASEMGGLGSWTNVAGSKPQIIAAGCDMILFSSRPDEDIADVLQAVVSGEISKERFDDAVLHVLGMKAALGLHRQTETAMPARRAVLATPANAASARAITARAPTLAKDVQKLLPLDLQKHRRILVISGGIISPIHPEPPAFALPGLLRGEGFEVTVFTPDTEVTAEKFDLVLYIFGEETLLTRGRIFLDWAKVGGNLRMAMRRFWHEVPTAMISFGYPYYLYDAPRMPTSINAWCTMDDMQAAVLECLMGRQPWNRSSPVDPFCGLPDAQW